MKILKNYLTFLKQQKIDYVLKKTMTKKKFVVYTNFMNLKI